MTSRTLFAQFRRNSACHRRLPACSHSHPFRVRFVFPQLRPLAQRPPQAQHPPGHAARYAIVHCALAIQFGDRVTHHCAPNCSRLSSNVLFSQRSRCTPSARRRVSSDAFTPLFAQIQPSHPRPCLTTFGRLSRFQETDSTRQWRTVSDVCTSTCRVASLSLCNPNSRFYRVRLF
jgi:hypothetical protein